MPLRKGLSKYLKNRSINQSNLIGVVFGAIFILIFASIIAYQEYVTYKTELIKLEEEYMNAQKNLIQKETQRALQYIEYMDKKYQHTIPKDEIQRQVVDAIEQMRDTRDGSGYIFVYTFEGINIADPILKINSGKNLIDFKDPTGKLVIKELIDVSKLPEGGFVEYIWEKPFSNKLSPKISYASSYLAWNWMVGSGVYIDSIEEVLAKRSEEYQRSTIDFILKVFLVGGLLFLMILLLSKSISSMIKKEVNSFVKFFSDAATKKLYINREELGFVEFLEISKYANNMVDEIKEKTEELEELNRTLEQKVEEKTYSLQQKTIQLEDVISRQDRFLKNSIHEVFTPISIIFANIDLLKLKDKDSHHLAKIDASAKTIKNIYDDLSYMVKKDIQVFQTKEIDLVTFIKNRIEYFKELAQGNGVAFEYDLEDDFYIKFNETELQRVIDNTFSNAIKYSKSDTKIDVLLHNGRLDVKNIGKEIKDLSKIFERHYREDEARGGFGIGLSIVKEICDKYSVKIEVKCEGTEITFSYIFLATTTL